MKSLAAHHPLISELNGLDKYDYLEGSRLIYRCFEHGIFEWSNPKFLAFLKEAIWGLLYTAPCERKQLRGLMYARYVAEHMPPGADDDIRQFCIAIAAGEPQAKLVRGQWRGPACLWPSPRVWPMSGFWLYQERIVNGRLSMEMRRRQLKLERQRRAS